MSRYLESAAKIINDILYVTIATADKAGQPWNSPVYSAFDENLNFYWTSAKDSQHSQNIRENSKGFLVIYDSTVAEGQGEGVYVQAMITELTDPDEITHARKYTQTRKGQEPDGHEMFVGDMHRRIYKAAPMRIWMNDAERLPNGYRDFRVEIDVDKLKAII